MFCKNKALGKMRFLFDPPLAKGLTLQRILLKAGHHPLVLLPLFSRNTAKLKKVDLRENMLIMELLLVL